MDKRSVHKKTNVGQKLAKTRNRSDEQRTMRRNEVSRRRNLTPRATGTPKRPTQQLSNVEQRKQMLTKWKKEKEEKKQQDRQKELAKKPFRVKHVAAEKTPYFSSRSGTPRKSAMSVTNASQKSVTKPSQKSVTSTSQKSSTKTSQKPATKTSQKPATKTSQKPGTKTSEKPATKTSQKSSTSASQYTGRQTRSRAKDQVNTALAERKPSSAGVRDPKVNNVQKKVVGKVSNKAKEEAKRATKSFAPNNFEFKVPQGVKNPVFTSPSLGLPVSSFMDAKSGRRCSTPQHPAQTAPAETSQLYEEIVRGHRDVKRSGNRKHTPTGNINSAEKQLTHPAKKTPKEKSAAISAQKKADQIATERMKSESALEPKRRSVRHHPGDTSSVLSENKPAKQAKSEASRLSSVKKVKSASSTPDLKLPTHACTPNDEADVYKGVSLRRLSPEQRDDIMTRKARVIISSSEASTSSNDANKPDPTVANFRDKVEKIQSDFRDLGDRWEPYLTDENTPEYVLERVRSAVGKAKLLVGAKGRLHQFESLMDSCEDGSGEKKTLVSDLHGFWDMVAHQVDDVYGMFKKLNDDEVDGWPAQEEQRTVATQQPRKRVKKPKVPTTKKAKSRFAEFKAKLKNNNVNDPSNNLVRDVNVPTSGATPRVGSRRSVSTKSARISCESSPLLRETLKRSMQRTPAGKSAPGTPLGALTDNVDFSKYLQPTKRHTPGSGRRRSSRLNTPAAASLEKAKSARKSGSAKRKTRGLLDDQSFDAEDLQPAGNLMLFSP